MLGSQLAKLDFWPLHKEEQPKPYDPIDRLNWPIRWHRLANRQAMRWYASLKVIEISAAAAIPVLVTTGGNSPVAKGWIAGLGALIVVIEGIQQMKKYARNGLLWAQGKEALKREYYLYQAKVDPYNQRDPRGLLALRIEQIVGQEVSKWADLTETKPDGADTNPQPDPSPAPSPGPRPAPSPGPRPAPSPGPHPAQPPGPKLP
jgi:hypothetical protein